MDLSPEVWTFNGARMSVWREAPSLETRKTAALGAFSCDTSQCGAAALAQAATRLQAEGFGAILGPMDGDTWSAHRLVTQSDGRPPFLMEPENPTHYPDAFEAAGFDVVGRYASAARPVDIPPSATPPPSGVTLRTLNLDAFEDDLKQIFDLSLITFAGNAFYKPIGWPRFLASYAPVKDYLDPELVFLAMDEAGALKGFLFGVPSFAEESETNTVILKTYASAVKGAGSMLANAFHVRAGEKGFSTVIHALMHEDNLSASHSANTGGDVFRRYALWGIVL